jgi:hypothetical protein
MTRQKNPELKEKAVPCHVPEQSEKWNIDRVTRKQTFGTVHSPEAN